MTAEISRHQPGDLPCQAETYEHLLRRERQLQSILDNVPAKVGYWNRELRNGFANNAYRAWFGLDPATLPGKHLREVIGEEGYLANLPYIATEELATLEVSRHEPRLALDGGADGLDVIRRLLTQIPSVCNPGALILLEIGADQGNVALKLAQTTLSLENAEILKDYAGLDRIVKINFISPPA